MASHFIQHFFIFSSFICLSCVFSSLSQWVHACDALELSSQQREQLDAFIDQLYKDIDKSYFPFNFNPFSKCTLSHTLGRPFI